MKLILFLLIASISFTGLTQAEEKTSVLFVGNSFTFHNNMPVIFKEIAESLNKAVLIDTVVQGGKDIMYHSKQELTYSKIKERKWDYIVIQGHSNEFAKYDPEIINNTLPFLEQILDSVKANHLCTKVLMYMTWGYKYGNSDWEKINSYPSMQNLIEKQYLRTADYVSVSVSPVGAVWRKIRRQKSRINLYAPDDYHPSKYGSYVSACTFFTSIFGVSPFGAEVNLKINSKKKSDIELIATEIVLKDRPKWRQSDFKLPMETGFDLIQNEGAVHLVSNAKRYNSIEWFLGDGTYSTDSNVDHFYKVSGEYEITQRVSDACEIKELTRIVHIQK